MSENSSSEQQSNANEHNEKMSFRCLLVGVILSFVTTGSNAYMGLYAGQTVSATITATILSAIILNLFKNPATTTEINIVQTMASAGEAIAAGAIFSLPALIMIGSWHEFDYYWSFIVCAMGGWLGVLFSTPLRRFLIVKESKNLIFLDGVIAANLIKTITARTNNSSIIFSSLIASLQVLCGNILNIWPKYLYFSQYIGSATIVGFALNISPALLGIGCIISMKVCFSMVLGGFINTFILIPAYYYNMKTTDLGLMHMISAHSSPFIMSSYIWSIATRYVGVGALLTSSSAVLLSIFPSILKEFIKYGKSDEIVDDKERDIPVSIAALFIIISSIPLFIIFEHLTHSFISASIVTLFMIIAGLMFSSATGYTSGLLSSSSSPISNIMAATMILASILVICLLGKTAEGPIIAILIGTVVTAAASIAAENLHDLKCGQILGTPPYKQQIAIFIGCIASALIIPSVLNLILHTYGIGGIPSATHPHPLSAPQACMMAALINGIFDIGPLPYSMIMGGVLSAIVLEITSRLIKKYVNKNFDLPIIGIAVGAYLPLDISLTVFLGSLVGQVIWRKVRSIGGDTHHYYDENIIYSAGLVTGESMMGMLSAIIMLGYSKGIDIGIHLPNYAGGIYLLVVAYCIYRNAVNHTKVVIKNTK